MATTSYEILKFVGRQIVAQVHLTLPKATNLPTQTKPENITVSIDKTGAIYWNTKLLGSVEDLKTNLRTVARVDPQPEVHIRGDAEARYMFVGRVLVAAQQIGIRKVAFLTEPDRLGVGR
jgi:biopolymer transport protein ExbD